MTENFYYINWKIWVIIIPETQNKGTKMLDDRALQFDLNFKK